VSCVVVTLLAQQRGAHSARCCVRIGGTRVQQRAAVSGCVVPQRNPRRRFNGPDMNAAYRTGGARLRRYRAIIDDRTARGWICCSGAASSVGTGGTRHSGGHGAPSATRACGMGSSGGVVFSSSRGCGARLHAHEQSSTRRGVSPPPPLSSISRVRFTRNAGEQLRLGVGRGGMAERERQGQQRSCCCFLSLTFTPACRPPSPRR